MTTIPQSVPFILGATVTPPPPPFEDVAAPHYSVDRLSPDQLAAYHTGLCRSHERRVSIDVLHLNGDHAGTLGLATMDGSIAVTKPAADAVSRVLTLNTADPDRVLDFAPTSPGENVFFDRMLRVHDARCIPDLGWVTATPFTGPLWTFSRNGNDVALTAHGKERLAMGSLWTTMTLHKGMHKVDAIRALLERTGETELDLPHLPAEFNFGTHVVGKGKGRHRMPEHRSLDRFSSPWAAAQKIARSLNRQLYYDGHGVCHLRVLPSRTGFRFSGGDGGSVLSSPQVTRDLSNFANTWLVLGKKPKGSKHRAHAVVRIPADHPLSAESLGRSGHPRVIAVKIEDTSLGSDHECRQVGERHMADAIRGTVEASFSAASIPDREVGDLCDLVLPGQAPVSFRLWEFTLPLHVGVDNNPVPMTVGKVKRTPRRRGRG